MMVSNPRRRITILFALVSLLCTISTVECKKKRVPEGPRKFVLIGAGLSGTGTEALRRALDILEIGPSYTSKRVGKANQQQLWIDHADGRASINWKDLFTNHSACLGFPTAVFYKEIAEAFPEAKVILTVVTDPKEWHKTITSHLFAFQKMFEFRFLALWISSVALQVEMFAKTHGKLFGKFAGGLPGPSDEAAAVKIYRDWETEVKESIPADRLLVYNVNKEWKPLCEFLGVPVPSVPFPKDKDEYQWTRRKTQGIFWFCTILAVALLFGIGYESGCESGYDKARKHFKMRTAKTR